MVGTTEVADSGDPGKTAPSAEEINYLVRSVAQLFPKAKISAQSVKYVFRRSSSAALFPGQQSFGGNAEAHSSTTMRMTARRT